MIRDSCWNIRANGFDQPVAGEGGRGDILVDWLKDIEYEYVYPMPFSLIDGRFAI